MKYKIEDELLYEITTLKYLQSELEEYKKIKQDTLRSMIPQDVGSVDYEKWRVDGGVSTTIEQELNKLITTQQNIIALESIIRLKSEIIDKKSNCIKEVLTERERLIYDKTFIEGKTCDDVAYQLNLNSRTIQRDRASIISKIRKIETKIAKITENVV